MWEPNVDAWLMAHIEKTHKLANDRLEDKYLMFWWLQSFNNLINVELGTQGKEKWKYER